MNRRSTLALLSIASWMFAIPAGAQVARSDFPVVNSVVNAMVRSGNTLYLGGGFTRIGPASGGGVPLDRTSGAPLAGFPKVAGNVQAAIPDGAGGWFIGGAFTSVGGQPRNAVARINSDLTVSSWNPGVGLPTDVVMNMVLVGSTLYVGGTFKSIGGVARHDLAALDVSTASPTSWNPHPNGSDITAMASNAGMLFVGGHFDSIGTTPRRSLAAFNLATGQLKPWNPSTFGEPRAFVLDGDGMYIAGAFNEIGGTSRSNLALVDTTAGLVRPWAPTADQTVWCMTEVGGTLYIGGDFFNVNGTPRSQLAAVDAVSGALSAWNPGPNEVVTSLAAAGSKVYAGGYFTKVGGFDHSYLARIDAVTGAVDPWDSGVNWIVLAIVPGDTVYAGGYFTGIGGLVRNHLAAIDLSTGAVTSWNPNADDWVNQLSMSGGTIYAAGNFLNVGGLNRNAFAAVDAATGNPTGWTPSVDGIVRSLVAHGSTVYVGGILSGAGGQVRQNILALDGTTGAVTSWAPMASSDVYSIAALAGRVYIGGTFSSVNGTPRASLAAIDSASGQLFAWNPSKGARASALAAVGDRVYAGGNFPGFLAALDTTSGTTLWSVPGSGILPRWLEVDRGVVFAGGPINTVSGTTRRGAAAVRTDDGALTPWNPDVFPQVFAVVSDGSSVYLGGHFWSAGLVPAGFLTAIPTDQSTSTLPSVFDVENRDGAVTITWYADEAHATVERCTDASVWEPLGDAGADGSGRLRYEDRSVVAGRRYGYRLSIDGVTSGEVWVTAGSARVAFEGVWPNPARRGEMMAHFTLPDAQPAEIALYDVAGRRVAHHAVGVLGPGAHAVNLAGNRKLAAGVYVVRFSRGTFVRNVRVVALD